MLFLVYWYVVNITHFAMDKNIEQIVLYSVSPMEYRLESVKNAEGLRWSN